MLEGCVCTLLQSFGLFQKLSITFVSYLLGMGNGLLQKLCHCHCEKKLELQLRKNLYWIKWFFLVDNCYTVKFLESGEVIWCLFAAKLDMPWIMSPHRSNHFICFVDVLDFQSVTGGDVETEVVLWQWRVTTLEGVVGILNWQLENSLTFVCNIPMYSILVTLKFLSVNKLCRKNFGWE